MPVTRHKPKEELWLKELKVLLCAPCMYPDYGCVCGEEKTLNNPKYEKNYTLLVTVCSFKCFPCHPSDNNRKYSVYFHIPK